MKNLIITGGAGGIGQEIVKKFVRNGYFVYILDTDLKASKKLVEELGKDKCSCANVDVRDVKALDKFVKSLGDDFALNCLITCAGRALHNEWKPFCEQTYSTIKDSVELNLIGHLYSVYAFLPLLKNATGDRSILFVSSINATDCFNLSAYSSAKSGLYGFMNSTVKEFGEMGIRINTLSPGTIKTKATDVEPKEFDKLLSCTALNRFATTKNVADTAFAICDIIDGITGQNIVVDAGQTKIH